MTPTIEIGNRLSEEQLISFSRPRTPDDINESMLRLNLLKTGVEDILPAFAEMIAQKGM
jgi:hypothetical protein